MAALAWLFLAFQIDTAQSDVNTHPRHHGLLKVQCPVPGLSLAETLPSPLRAPQEESSTAAPHPAGPRGSGGDPLVGQEGRLSPGEEGVVSEMASDKRNQTRQWHLLGTGPPPWSPARCSQSGSHSVQGRSLLSLERGVPPCHG